MITRHAMVRARSFPTQFDESKQRVKHKYDKRRLLRSKDVFVQHAEYYRLGFKRMWNMS